jgi:cell division protein FtsB
MSSSRRTYVAYGAILCLVAALLFLWLSLGRNGLIDLYKMQKEREKHESILRNLKDNNRLLAAEIRRLTQDPKYFESVARREMGLVKENEIIYRTKGGGKGK